MVGVYCHFCCESGTGGRHYASNDNIAVATAMYTKRAAGRGDTTGNNCKCNKEFKGRCDSCEGETFVDDGELGSPRDFANFGGDQGFAFPGAGGGANGAEDPIRGFMSNGSAPTARLDQPDHTVSFEVGGGSQY